jgi:hypothetical protein
MDTTIFNPFSKVFKFNGKDYITFNKDFENEILNSRTWCSKEAYDTNYNQICYVDGRLADEFADGRKALLGWEDDELAFPFKEVVHYFYSHNDLLCVAHGNSKLCDQLFSTLYNAEGAKSPETVMEEWLNNLDIIDFEEYYGFVAAGKQVYWFDYWGDGCGDDVFTVDDDGRFEGKLNVDSLVKISNEHSEAEVPIYECLSPEDYEHICKHIDD